jgi:hypothetical protein
LRSALAERDYVIATFKQNEDSFPSQRLVSEVSLFAQFAESITRRLTNAQVISHYERRNLEASAQRFATIAPLNTRSSK